MRADAGVRLMSFRRGLGWSAVALTVAAVLAGGAAVAAPLPASMRASGQAPKQPAKPGPSSNTPTTR
ncbi:MAG: hypothetical protein DMF86_18990 [Acidobacteria bacterium]|nr:MAG: hypothetical protein DMF86_18990 [Acidobacteriota bacterium]